MKYFNIKRYKFSTILNNLSKLSDIFVNKLSNIFFKTLKFNYIKRYNLRKIISYNNIKKVVYPGSLKFYILRKSNFNFINKKYISSNRIIFLHIPLAIIFFFFLYLVIPTFYNYNKLQIVNSICNTQKIKCKILGKVSYSFYPSPRIKIKKVEITNLSEKKDLFTVEKIIVKLSIKNLFDKDTRKFKSIKLDNFMLNLNIKSFKDFESFFKVKVNKKYLTFTKGQIALFNNNDYIGTIENVNSNIKFKENESKAILRGKFLNNKIIIKSEKKMVDDKYSIDYSLKVPDLNSLTKINFVKKKNNNHINKGNFSIKVNKNSIAGIFNYKDNRLEILKSNVRNIFVDGKLGGEFIFLPYFNFNLDLHLNSLNFTSLYNNFLTLNIEKQRKIFQINNKINGFLNITADKIYAKNNLVKSVESRLKFYNGNIKIEQFLINLGKLGAADLSGTIENDNKKSSLKFESNIFIDNKKKFLNRYGIYNKEKINSNLFISGNFDFRNIKSSFYEINDGKKLKEDDVNFIETEFNDTILNEEFVNLFNFYKFKIFLKSIFSDKN